MFAAEQVHAHRHATCCWPPASVRWGVWSVKVAGNQTWMLPVLLTTANSRRTGSATSAAIWVLGLYNSCCHDLHHRAVQSTESPISNIDSVHSHQSSSYSSGSWLARRLLSRPGYVSLGLQTSRASLEQGLEAVFTAATESEYRHLNYFKPPGSGPSRDVGPDLDPVDLGLVTMEEAYYLFPM